MRQHEVGEARSIPAWAGETHPDAGCGQPHAVYPRVGGGNRRHAHAGGRDDGLSPRGRGKLGVDDTPLANARSIPAWAGETGARSGGYYFAAVYPRVGGGNDRTELAEPYARKVYPRVGGGNAHVYAANRKRRGLSPRGRGKRNANARRTSGKRSIPAWAGETMRWAILRAPSKVYPRVGGGNAQLRRGAALA